MTFQSILYLVALSGVASLYYQPGIPPQCFDAYQCVFNRLPSETGLVGTYTWDLHGLCAGAGQEYTATSSLGYSNIIKFNLCGVVGTPIAPARFDAQGPQESPIPHSHGVAIQYIVDPNDPNPTPPPGPNGDSTCADLDTCDYLRNPVYLSTGVCVIGSLNYQKGVSPSFPAREALCDPAIGGNPNYCSPYSYWCCSVKKTTCTGNAEVLSFYDGSAPSFRLVNESSVNAGVVLSYASALNFAADPFQCGGSDPSTGNPYTRSLSIQLDCDPTVTSGLSNVVYSEDPVQICQYSIRARTAAACATMVIPPNVTCNATSTPAGAAASAISVAGPAVGSFFGGAILAAIIAFSLVYLGYTSACPRAKGVSGGGGGGSSLSEASPLMASSGQVAMRIAPPHNNPPGLEAFLNDLTGAQFKILREKGALSVKGDFMGPVGLTAMELDTFSVRQQLTLGKMGLLIG